MCWWNIRLVSLERPMTNEQLQAKFMDQAGPSSVRQLRKSLDEGRCSSVVKRPATSPSDPPQDDGLATRYRILLAGVVVCFIGGLLGGLSGAGTGLIVAGFLTPIIGAKAVMPALAVIMLINNGSRVFYYRQGVHWKLAAGTTAIALPGTWMGAHLYMACRSPRWSLFWALAILAVLPFDLPNVIIKSTVPPSTEPVRSGGSEGPCLCCMGFSIVWFQVLAS